MVPLPVPVLSEPTLAVSAALNAARGPGGTLPPDHWGGTSPYVTEWVSVKSGSLKTNVPLVAAAWPAGSFAERKPATTSLSPVKASTGTEVLMSGTSLVPVIVIVNGLTVIASFGAKLLSTRAR